ncbi:hypothetical protein HOH87_02280 [bacterium]|jgi:hypothetical protein|nr:hypothetical protein [bacterium]
MSMEKASGLGGPRPATPPQGKPTPKSKAVATHQSDVSRASSSALEMMPYAQALKDNLVQPGDTIPLVDDELSRPRVDSSGKMTWEANSKNLGHDTYTCDVVYDPNERLFYAESKDGKQKNVMFSPAKLRKALEKGLGIPLTIKFDDDNNLLVTSGGRLKGSGPKTKATSSSEAMEDDGNGEVSPPSSEDNYRMSESDSATGSAGSREDSIIARLSLSGDRPDFNSISNTGKLNAIHDLLTLEQIRLNPEGPSTSLLEAFNNEDLPRETTGELTEDGHKALN